MLAACPCWTPDESRGIKDKDAGTQRHEYLRLLLTDPAKAAEMRDDVDGADTVDTFAEYVKVKAPTSDYPLRCEFHVDPQYAADFKPIFENGGTLDVSCGTELFDLKTRERDYYGQMCAYALAIFQEYGFDRVKVHLLFAATGKWKTYSVTEAEAEKEVLRIVLTVTDNNRKPTPCEYCGWCSQRLFCQQSTVREIAVGYSDLEKVKTWHPSKMETADEIAISLWVARNVLKHWLASVEFHALEAAQKKGMSLPGFELTTKAGKQYVTSTAEAFALCGLPQSDFLSACEPRLNTSKTYPDKVGIIDLYAKVNGLKKAQAKRSLLEKLAPVLKQGKDSIYLKSAKGDDGDNDGD